MKATPRESSRPAGSCVPCVDRRAFVASVAALSVATLFSGCASLAAVPVQPDQGRITLRFLHHPSLLEPGGSLRVRPAGESSPVYVLVLPDGGYAAVSPICTHQGCTVDIAGRHLVCPCHGSTYLRDGTVVRGPAPQSLRRFPIERTEDALIIDLGGGE
jgi:Rieske Fe-S protein